MVGRKAKEKGKPHAVATSPVREWKEGAPPYAGRAEKGDGGGTRSVGACGAPGWENGDAVG